MDKLVLDSLMTDPENLVGAYNVTGHPISLPIAANNGTQNSAGARNGLKRKFAIANQKKSSAKIVKPHSERTKVSRACDACKDKKTRCSGTHPCVRCEQLGLTCNYLALYTRGRPPAVPEVPPVPAAGPSRAVDFHVPSEEDPTPSHIIAGFTAFPLSDSSFEDVPPHPASAQSPVPSTDFGGQYHGPSSPITFLERAWKRIKRHHHHVPNDEMEQEALSRELNIAVGDEPYAQVVDQTLYMPRKEYTQQLLKRFFSFTSSFYRLLHQPTINHWIEIMYRDPLDPSEPEITLSSEQVSVILTVLMVASFDPASAIEKNTQSTLFLTQMQTRMRRKIGHPTLELVQVRILECYHLLCTSRANEVYTKFGALVQMAFTLGLHRRHLRTGYRHGMSPIEIECRKRAFWAIYVFDRYLSVMGGRPRLLHESDIDQEFPERVNDEDLSASGIKPRRGTFDCAMDASIMHIKLCSIISTTSQEIYTLRPLSREEILPKAQKGIASLITWRSQLPMFLGGIDPSSLIPVLKLQSIILRLAYAHAVIHATRHFLLINFSQVATNADISQRRLFQHHIDDCVQAAKDVVDLLSLFEDDATNGAYLANWFTQYVAFCAVAVLYIYEFQKRQDQDLATTMPHMTKINFDNIEGEAERDYFASAERCQRRLANAALVDSPGKKYDMFLEELRVEVRQLRVNRNDSHSRQDATSANQPQTVSSMDSDQYGTEHDNERTRDGRMEMDLDLSYIFDNWVIPEWAGFGGSASAGPI